MYGHVFDDSPEHNISSIEDFYNFEEIYHEVDREFYEEKINKIFFYNFNQ